MQALVWIGAIMSVIGLAGLLYSIFLVNKAKKASQSDEELRDAIKAAMPINLGALFLSTLGLMCVIVGLFLT